MSRDAINARICGCLMDSSFKDFPEFLAHTELDLVEWRLDSFIENYGTQRTLEMLPLLSFPSRLPLVVTNRHRQDGGLWGGEEDERLELLGRAVKAGAEWVDLEDRLDPDEHRLFKSMGTHLLISYHELSETPSSKQLRRKLEKMAQAEPDVIKIATFARKPEDNLRVLDLISFGRNELNTDVIAFCMGPLGRWSRAVCLILGSPWTYARIPGQTGGAPGQYTAREIRSLTDLL